MKALFLDRDGTIIIHKPYLHKPEDVELTANATDALKHARRLGYALYLFSNQSGVGRGLFSMEDVHRVNTRMLELLGLGSDLFSGICIAPEHPDAPANYRKPSPRYILEAINHDQLAPAQCWMIGDSPSDWQSGISAGINVAAIRSDLMSEKEEKFAKAHGIHIYNNLMGFCTGLTPGRLKMGVNDQPNAHT